jgi:Helix-turn-helix domain
MAMGRPKAAFVLRPEQRDQLEGMAGSRSLPAGLVSRARIILLSASGKTNQQIALHMGLTNATVGKWRRFLEQDVSGLRDELRPGRPRPISETLARSTATILRALHSDLCLVAQSSGDLVQPGYAAGHSPRNISQRQGTDRENRSIRSNFQPSSATFRLDRHRRFDLR